MMNMKLLLMEQNKKKFNEKVDGYILPLEDFSVSYKVKYSLEEIEGLVKDTKKEIFVLINKNIENFEISALEKVLCRLSELNVDGVFFYDLAVLSIVRRLGLSLGLIWSQTHMVTNYNTINYYYEKGAKGAHLSNEITLDEMIEIKKKVKSKIFADVIYQPVVSFSKRHLVENYYKSRGKDMSPKSILVNEKISNQEYLVNEEENGTTFVSLSVVNGTRMLESMIDAGIEYGIIDVRTIDEELFLDDVLEVLSGNFNEDLLLALEKKIGSNTGFFRKKTIYKVK